MINRRDTPPTSYFLRDSSIEFLITEKGLVVILRDNLVICYCCQSATNKSYQLSFFSGALGIPTLDSFKGFSQFT